MMFATTSKRKKERDMPTVCPQIQRLEKDAKWSDIVVFDDTLGQAKRPSCSALPVSRRRRHPLYRPPRDDRSFGQEELKPRASASFPTKTSIHSTFAIDFVKRNPDRYVIKPSGEAQNVKRRLFVGEEETATTLFECSKPTRKPSQNEIKIFQLQRRINGVEVAVGAFFNGKKIRHSR